MPTTVKDILHSFELLSEDEKKELASEIMRYTVKFDLPPITDEDIVSCAEEIFLNLTEESQKMVNPERGEVWLVDLGLAAIEDTVRLWPGL